jgi:hypothetical protein
LSSKVDPVARFSCSTFDSSGLSFQLAEARQPLSPLANEAQMQAMLQVHLSTPQQALNEQAGAFLPEAEIPVVLSHLYRYRHPRRPRD